MAPLIKTPRAIVTVDPNKRPWEQTVPLHNRWHPEIPPVGTVEEGEVFRVETVDWTGRQIGNNDSAEDMKNIDLTSVSMHATLPRPLDVVVRTLLTIGACRFTI